MKQLKCPVCKKRFEAHTMWQVYCSGACRVKALRLRRKRQADGKGKA